ncbi:MAG TPA: S41 family peptidase [Bacteroidales bacterium]|nr:S41 family peptidase [Bacteroidales bacterium]
MKIKSLPNLNLDWDSVYRVYKPQINNNMTDKQLFDVLAEMTYLLKDGHVNLYSKNEISNYSGWYDIYPLNQINISRQLELVYVPSNVILYSKISGHSIGYIYISSFSGEAENYEAIDEILEKFSNLKGIIIDVRSNGGGNSRNADLIASRFIDKERLVIKYRYCNGPEHTDFTRWYDYYLQPDSGNNFLKPVAVLTNRRCFSSTEWFLAEMDAIPHATIVGDTSGGGSGNPLIRQLPNGWMFRLSNSQNQLPEGRDFQYTGIYPDIPVWITPADSARGHDTILETAIDIIENQ